MSGCPASGKSTWVRNRLDVNSEWISRDKVRFSLVSEDEEYFSREDEVFETFISWINQALANPDIENIFIDATHLNKKSRDKMLYKLDKTNIGELNSVCFITPLKVCLQRNEKRTGREKVPRSAVRRMFFSFSLTNPLYENFSNIIFVDENGNEVKAFE